MSPTPHPLQIAEVLERVGVLRAAVSAADAALDTEELHTAWQDSARNLAQYVALRQHDLRDLQRGLAILGLSSLGRSEADVHTTLERVDRALRALVASGEALAPAPGGRPLLDAHADALFGLPPDGRRVRIMLTASADLAHDAERVRALVLAGTDIVRINCAHDDPETWRAIARQVRAASAETGRPCALLADLAGPKLRTGDLAPGPAVVDWHVRRDELGRMVAPARVWFGLPELAPAEVDAVVPLAPGLRSHLLRVGDGLRFVDARGRRRTLTIEAASASGVLATADRAAWITSNTALRRVRARRLGPPVATVGSLPPRAVPLRLRPGDTLRLTRAHVPGGVDDRGPHIPVTLEAVLTSARPGEPIFFDDGRIGGEIAAVGPDELDVRITRAPPGGAALRGDKGINLPETQLPVPALTEADLASLDVIVDEVDIVGLSFVRSPADIRLLRAELGRRGRADLGVLLKIETKAGFACLPALLVEAMRRDRVGVMIARGDLAVECGFERLAEVQEEILWICEAAHVPVVWATQVLDSLTRRGVATRAEVTDAAAGQRAECVMLNKGPHAELAVRTLDDILRRMATHQMKKTAMLRRLRTITGMHEAE